MTLRTRSTAAVLALLLVTACNAAPPSATELDWMHGDWQGVRLGGDDGSEEPIVVHVEALWGQPGHIERLQVQLEGEAYTGFAVRTPSGEGGHWRMLYANSTRESLSRLEGEATGDRLVLRSVTPDRARDSEVVMERLGEDRWIRTNRVSEDGGATWRVLFTDDLRRRG